MTDLTEQWYEGTLEKDKYYYAKDSSEGDCIVHINKSNEMTFTGWEVPYEPDQSNVLEPFKLRTELLAQVPSFIEYERILVENDSLKQIRDELDCAVTQLREDITDYKETIDEQERELSDSAFREDNLEKENAHLAEQLIKAKQAMSQALSYLACMDRISDTEPNEQLAFDVLRKCLEELENA